MLWKLKFEKGVWSIGSRGAVRRGFTVRATLYTPAIAIVLIDQSRVANTLTSFRTL